MCGIIGYVGNKEAKQILINGLLRLEYRGYDSAGIATVSQDNVLNIVKNKGRIKDLMENKNIDSLTGTIGIGHTRWATHGIPSETNSHPHVDQDKLFTVVHNGIIENYALLKDMLTKAGYNFYSQTDTEVVPNLINYNLKKEKDESLDSVLHAIKVTCDELEGSYALEILSPLIPNYLIVTRRNSPLIIGSGHGENYVSSDIPAILSYTNNFYLLDNNEYAVITDKSVDFYNESLTKIEKEVRNIAWDMSAAEKEGFDDYMLKEIFEQPKSIRETIGSRLLNGKTNLPDFEISEEKLKEINKIYIVACGTAMHAGLACKRLYEHLLGIETVVDVASEFRYKEPLVDDKTLCIFVSQSGETADTIAALRLAKENGALTIAITNVISSSITREADYSLYTHAGPEIAVASTKAYTAQIILLTILAINLSETLHINLVLGTQLKQELVEIPSKVEKILSNIESIKNFASKVYKETDSFFIGRLEDYAAALEGSLKLKEISYIHSEAYPAGELKHGPIALIEDNVTIIGLITNPLTAPKTLSNVEEVLTRGAKALIITNQIVDQSKFDLVYQIPEISEYLSPVLSVIPLQLFAYYISKEKGLDVDKPRNLAKSVTVE